MTCALDETHKFPKEFRLLNSQDFSYLRHDASRFRSKTFVVYFKKSRFNLGHARIGLSVSKKTGHACRRNLIKRIIRESFRLSSLKSSPFDALVVISSRTNQLDANELRLQLRDDFARFNRFLTSSAKK